MTEYEGLTIADIDQLYHILRKVSNEEDDTLNSVLYGLARHLLQGGDYPALLTYLDYYGTGFLAKPIVSELGFEYDRIVEFGSGTGWLARTISAYSGLKPCLFVDKREWARVDIVADLETPRGRSIVLDELRETDLIVMSEFLHCLDAPMEIMSYFEYWDKVVVEYMPLNPEMQDSYDYQLLRFGAVSLDPVFMKAVFPRIVNTVHLDPYTAVYVAGSRHD